MSAVQKQLQGKKNTFNFHSLLAPYMEIMEIIELPALSKQPILPTPTPAVAWYFPVQVFLSKTTFFICGYVCACRGQSKVLGVFQYCSAYYPDARYITEPARPNEFFGSTTSPSQCWGRVTSILTHGVLIGVLGTLTQVLTFTKASALTHSQHLFVMCIRV